MPWGAALEVSLKEGSVLLIHETQEEALEAGDVFRVSSGSTIIRVGHGKAGAGEDNRSAKRSRQSASPGARQCPMQRVCPDMHAGSCRTNSSDLHGPAGAADAACSSPLPAIPLLPPPPFSLMATNGLEQRFNRHA
jgi:hypothetical protein